LPEKKVSKNKPDIVFEQNLQETNISKKGSFKEKSESLLPMHLQHSNNYFHTSYQQVGSKSRKAEISQEKKIYPL